MIKSLKFVNQLVIDCLNLSNEDILSKKFIRYSNDKWRVQEGFNEFTDEQMIKIIEANQLMNEAIEG